MDKCKGKKCPKGKICNPKSGRCVKLKGRLGRKLAKRKSKSKSRRKSRSKRKSKSRRKSPPVFKNYKKLPKEWSKNIKDENLVDMYLYIYSYWRYLREVGLFLWKNATHYVYTNFKSIKSDIFYEGITEEDLEEWSIGLDRSMYQAEGDLENKLNPEIF